MINPSFSLYFCHFVVSLLYLYIFKRLSFVLSLLLFHFIYFFQFDKIPKFDSPLYRHGVSTISGAVERGINFVFMRHLTLLPWGIQYFLLRARCRGLRILHLHHLSIAPIYHFPCSPPSNRFAPPPVSSTNHPLPLSSGTFFLLWASGCE